jgi:hypothetical protein
MAMGEASEKAAESNAADAGGGAKQAEAPEPRTVAWEPAKSVGWYDPRQLVRTGIRIATSELFATHADLRLLYPYLHPEETAFLCGGECAGDTAVAVHFMPNAKSITLDYIADTGDGFDASYAVAHVATDKELFKLNPELKGQLTEKVTRSLGGAPSERLLQALRAPGEILVLGGDEVYPTGTKSDYQQRFVVPFECASAELLKDGQRRLAFSIPGNHDWYENLTAFNEVFLRGKKVGAWDTVQKRSYFALQLPHDWWVFATDMQLESDLDGPQLKYFTDLAASLPPKAKVMLFHAEPHWVEASEEPSGTNVEKLERALGDRVKLLLAGDLHHYRRQQTKDGTQLVTAGGGGAFLHPTHRFDDDKKGQGKDEVVAYPSREQSSRVSKLALAFPFINGWFWLASGAIYGLFSMIVLLSVREAVHLKEATTIAWDLLLSPSLLTWVGILIGGFVAFTDTSKRSHQYIGGVLHGVAHAAVAIAVPWFAARWLAPGWLDNAGSLASLLLLLGAWVATTFVGALVGGWVMGLYLFLSLSLAGRHRNETFSAIRYTGYKSFLRLHIDEAGVLHGVAYGFDKTPRFDVPRRQTPFEIRRLDWPQAKSGDDSCKLKVVDYFSIK